jgi:folate-binding protein YgfZ
MDGAGIPWAFKSVETGLTAAQNTVALYDRTHWGCFRVSDADRLRFLHNQTTNRFQTRQPGEGCETVFVTSTARTLDLATAYILEDSVLVLVSPERRQSLLDWLDRYIFPFDQVKLQDVTQTTAIFHLIGPQSEGLLGQLGLEPSPRLAHSHHVVTHPIVTGGYPLRIAQGCGLGTLGYTLMVDRVQGAALWQQLHEAGAEPIGTQAWDVLRIHQGRPQVDRELTEDYNPLETGLWQTISFDKGCYIGQETIARLNTYNGVKQKLWGICLEDWVEPGTAITLDGNKVGILTSVCCLPGGIQGLAYIRTKAGGAGLTVQLGAVSGQILAVPFVTHPDLSSNSADR